MFEYLTKFVSSDKPGTPSPLLSKPCTNSSLPTNIPSKIGKKGGILVNALGQRVTARGFVIPPRRESLRNHHPVVVPSEDHEGDDFW